MAARNIYFIGINVKKGGEPGCGKTLSELRTIVEGAGGKPFTIEDFTIPVDPETGFCFMPDDLFQPEWTGCFYPPTNRVQFHQVVDMMIEEDDAD